MWIKCGFVSVITCEYVCVCLPSVRECVCVSCKGGCVNKFTNMFRV